MPTGAVFASLHVDTARTFGNGAKLLRLVELGSGGGVVGRQQRQLDLNSVWIGRDSDEKVRGDGEEGMRKGEGDGKLQISTGGMTGKPIESKHF